MSTPNTPDPQFNQNPQNPQGGPYAQGPYQGHYQGQPQPNHVAAGQYQPQPGPNGPGPSSPGPHVPGPQPAAGATHQAPPKPPTSDSAGPSRPLTVGTAPRSLMRVGVAVVGVLALLVPVSALAYTGVGLSTLTYEETTHELPADFEALAIDVSSASVEVEVRDDIDAPRVLHSYEGASAEVTAPDISADGSTVTVALPQTKPEFRWWAPNVGSGDTLTVELPAGQENPIDLDVTSDFGFVALAGEFGAVNVESQAGAMEIDVDANTVDARTRTGLLSVSGTMTDLTLETTTGYIDAPELAVDGTASAQTATGAIDLGFSEAAVPLEGIEAHARNGAVTVALPREERLSAQDVAGYSVNASSSSGWTDVAVQQTAPGEGVVPVTVSSESGSVDVHYGSDDWDGAEPGDGSGGDGDRGDGDRDDQDRDDRDRDGQDRDRSDQDRDRQDQEQDRREQDQDRQDPDRA